LMLVSPLPGLTFFPENYRKYIQEDCQEIILNKSLFL
jgi:hypothetical protein